MQEIHQAGDFLIEGLGEGTVGDGKMRTLVSAESDLQVKLSDQENKLPPWKTQFWKTSNSGAKA